MAQSFPEKLIEDLGYYVYMYSDPKTKKPFYVGKGTGNRAFSHICYCDDAEDSDEKLKKIAEIRKRGQEPTIEIISYGLDEETAYIVETAVIDLIGVDKLTNKVVGHGSNDYGRIEVDELIAQYADELQQGDIKEKVLCIVPNQLYHPGMSAAELYDATRGYWPVKLERAEQAKYVFAVYKGRILEVYEVKSWYPSGSTFMATRENAKKVSEERYEFVGRIASPRIRNKYKDKSLRGLYPPQTWQKSFKYINIPE